MKVERENLIKLLNYCNLPFKEYKDTIQVCNPFANEVPPYEEDRKFHMGLSYSKQAYNCFKTNMRGKLTGFVKRLAKKYNINLREVLSDDYYVESKVEKPAVKKETLVNCLPKEYKPILISSSSKVNDIFLNYLIRRGLSPSTIERCKFGYCTTGKYALRVIIPYLMNGSAVYFTARSIDEKSIRYLYPAESNKTLHLYNYDFCNKSNLIICEGQLNALVVNGVAIGGKDISVTQCKLIAALKPEKVTVALDQDEAGKRATFKVVEALKPYVKDLAYLDSPTVDFDFADLGPAKSAYFLQEFTKQYSVSNSLRSFLTANL